MEEELRDYGLSEKEVKIFLASQKTGQATANELSTKSGIVRTTTYEVLESLKQKGLISSFEKDKKLYFESISPRQILALLKEKERKIESIIPALESMRGASKDKPQTQIFIGQKGIKAVFEEILDKKWPYWTYANAEVFEKLNYYFPNFIKRRIELKIPVRVIEEETPTTRQHRKEQKKSHRNIRFSPVRFSASVFMYHNKVLFLDLTDDELVGVLITDKNIAEMQRQVFEILWQSSR